MKQDDYRISFVGFLILMVLTVATGISVYVVMQHQARSILSKSLEASLKSNVALFESQIAQGVNDTRMIATRPFITDNLTQINATPGNINGKINLRRIANSFLSYGFEGVSFYNASGAEVARAGRFLQHPKLRIPVNAKHKAFLLWDGLFILHASTDILDQQGRRIGIVVTEASLQPLPQALDDVTLIGKTGEFALCGPSEDDPLDMDCLLGRISGKKFLRLRRVVEDTALPMNYALEGKTGLIVAKDYRREKVVAAYAPVGKLGLGMVMKIDQKELYDPVTEQLKFIAVLLAGMVILGGLLLHWMVMPLVRQLVDSRRKLLASQQALQKENEKNLTLLRNASDGIHILDTGGNIIEVSDSFCDMLGYRRDEMIGMNVSQWDAGFSDTGLAASLKQQFAQHERFLFETRHRRKDGSVFDVEVSGFPLLLEGRPVLFNSSRNITERKQAESLIRMQSNALDSSTNGVAIADASDPGLPLIYVNPAFEEITGYPAQELLGRNCRILQGADRNQPGLAEIRSAIKEGRAGKATLRNFRKDGTPFWNRLHISPIFDKKGDLTHFLGIINDITERKHADDYLRLISSVFHYADEGILITDREASILEVNPAFSRITGYGREEVLGKNPRILHSDRQDQAFYGAMWGEILEKGHWSGEIWNKRKNGEIYPERLTLSAVKNEEGETIRYIALFSDISNLKNQQQQLERMAHHDALTGLPNRALLGDRLDMALAQTKRSGEKLAACFMDLDGFKPVNDTFGHEAGDLLLVEVAKRMLAISRATDTVARLGGDEFVLIFPDISGEAECRQMLTRIMETIGQPFEISGHEIRISASIGVAIYPDDDADGENLLRHADQAMYIAKQTGRNRFYFFDAITGRSN